MDVKRYEQFAKTANDISAELERARAIVGAVYTGKSSDAELGKALDAITAASMQLEDVVTLVHKDVANGAR